MELLLPVLSKPKHHTVICYFTVLGHTASDIYVKMTEVYSNLISYNIVKRWRHLNGHMEIADEPCQGWPSVINKDSINSVRALIEENGRITVAEIERYLLPRCGLQSSVAWNSRWNRPSSPRHEKNLCKIGLKIVGWRAQMEPSGHSLRLHVPLPCWRGGPIWPGSHCRWEIGSSFHTQDKDW